MSENPQTDTPEPTLPHAGPPPLEEGPSAEVPTKTIAIHLINQNDMNGCNFWLGLFHKGSLTPQKLLQIDDVEEVFKLAATEGLSESDPIMISNSEAETAKFYYLLPEPSKDIKSRAAWLLQLKETVKSWSPNRCGLYLAQNLLTKELIHELLAQIMRELIVTTKITDYFLLTGTHGTNSILSTALKIKNELEQDDVNVFVFH